MTSRQKQAGTATLTGHRVVVASVLVTLCFSAATVQAQGLQLDISAESERFSSALSEYRTIWDAEGTRIVNAMEQATDLEFEAGPVPVIVYEGPSNSGYRERPMRLRASYPRDTKLATLVHELAHRLILELVPATYDDHPIIFLFVYDVWVELWGKEFADEQVGVESARKGIVDYASIWQSVLTFTPEERAAKFRQWLADRKAGKPLNENRVN